MDVESVDLFRGALHMEHTDVSLPGKYGLDLNIMRWYDSKISDTTYSVGGTCKVYDWDQLQERGEVLGYGWRMHMGRFYYGSQAAPPSPGVLTETPTDYFELPGGKKIAFVQSKDTALYPGGTTTLRRMGDEFWYAVYPNLDSDPLIVYAPDGTKYTFASNARYSGASATVYCCTSISRGDDATIKISYSNNGVANGYQYITSITDTYGRVVNFSYYRDSIDTLTDPLYEITYPVAGRTAAVDYYYINSTADISGYNVDNPTFSQPSLGSLTTPTPIAPSGHNVSYFSLGMVKPPAGAAYETWYRYYIAGGNLLADVKFPNGTVAAYEFGFISRADFSGQTCYQVLTRRGKKGDLYAGSATSYSTIRKWAYTYSVPGTDQTQRFKVQVDEPDLVTTVSYFNPFVPLTGVSCTDGDCAENGIRQRWRVGLLLQEDVADRSSTGVLTVRRSTVRTYDRVAYDSIYYRYVNAPAQFAEKGFKPILTQEATKYDGVLTATKTWSNFDQYGNPGQLQEYDYNNSLLRKTTTTYAWADTSALKNLWVIQAPREVSIYDASSTLLRHLWSDYYTDTNHPGFPYRNRQWVNNDGTGTSYWQGTDLAYSSSGADDTVITSVGEASSMTGSLTVARKIVEVKRKGTPLSRQVQGSTGSPSIQVYSRTLDTNGLAPVTETVDGTTNFAYDTAGRLSTITPPVFTDNGSAQTPQVTTLTYSPTQVTKTVGASLEQTVYTFDGFGNLARKTTLIDAAKSVIEDTLTDSLGRATRKYFPAFSVAGKGSVVYAYDALNRVTGMTPHTSAAADPATTYAYSADTTLNYVKVAISSPKDADSGMATSYEWYDADGLLRRTQDALGNQVNYTYDSLGHLTQISQGSQTRVFTYSNLGQVLTSNLPESGATSFTYYHTAGLKKRSFADNTALNYAYDFAGRLTQVTFQDGSKVQNTYDAYPAGSCAVTSANPANHLVYQASLDSTGAVLRSVCNGYDSHGRLYRESYAIDGQTLDVKYDYSDRGELARITYPSGRQASVDSFNNGGLPLGLSDGFGVPIVTGMD